MYSHQIKVRVRYAETDRMGYMHHGRYTELFEMGRTEMLRSLGLTYREMEDQGIILPLQCLNIRFLAPAYYDDLLNVNTIIKQKPSVRLVFEYEIINEEKILLCKADSTLVFSNAKTGKPVRPPGYFINIISPFFD